MQTSVARGAVIGSLHPVSGARAVRFSVAESAQRPRPRRVLKHGLDLREDFPRGPLDRACLPARGLDRRCGRYSRLGGGKSVR